MSGTVPGAQDGAAAWVSALGTLARSSYEETDKCKSHSTSEGKCSGTGWRGAGRSAGGGGAGSCPV